jgi:hypothetical protein
MVMRSREIRSSILFILTKQKWNATSNQRSHFGFQPTEGRTPNHVVCRPQGFRVPSITLETAVKPRMNPARRSRKIASKEKTQRSRRPQRDSGILESSRPWRSSVQTTCQTIFAKCMTFSYCSANGHEFRESSVDSTVHPADELSSLSEFVFIGVHSRFPFFFLISTAGIKVTCSWCHLRPQ